MVNITLQQDKKELQLALNKVDYLLNKKYMTTLNQQSVAVVENPPEITDKVRIFKLERIAYDKAEDNLTKLSNVYNALYAVGGSVFLIIDSDGKNVNFYMGTKAKDNEDVLVPYKILNKAISGNFPGCSVKNLPKKRITRVLDGLFDYRDYRSSNTKRVVTSVSGISSVKNQIGNKEKQEFTQGIEKLVDAMRGEVYSVLILADPVPMQEIAQMQKGYEDIYSKLSPFKQAVLNVGISSTNGITKTMTEGINDSVSESLAVSEGTGKNRTIAIWSKSKNTTTTDTKSTTKGTSSSISDALSKTTGTSQSLQTTAEDRTVTNLLERLENQMDRLKECADYGMWNCAAYFIADDYTIANTAASTYQALMRGENSGLEPFIINTWSYGNDEDANKLYEAVCKSLEQVDHPQFQLTEDLPLVTPTSYISGSELTIQAGLPQKSIPGLAVANYAAFGREIQCHDCMESQQIKLGNVFHMGAEEKIPVAINQQSLTAHALVTGSTGAGKSNAVYQLLSELTHKNIPYLVIEPAKGEYKNVLGNKEGVNVYGTNSNKSELLRINPFKFPSDIHVLEHIDRLVEIFNVCWPMYAAMPAVLKSAIERAYIAAGWDFDTSQNVMVPPIYPNFADVLKALYEVIEQSDYSPEVKGNYSGALITRVKTLTTGLNGQIFTADELPLKKLFDENTIVDLSRVLSSESKALIMGILVMRLQEYRMSAGGMNRDLRHVTVLEEAHHLLKRTSTEQAVEGANLVGKSVEMLSQSIAEMRTYGEGFIIADQSPSMLDMSSIRNTNTKIILRLPDFTDRELCGKAAGLNDEQIVELAKLPTGVAAIYQNNWLEPVLCKVKFADADDESMYVYHPRLTSGITNDVKAEILKALLGKLLGDNYIFMYPMVLDTVIKANIPAYSKPLIGEILKGDRSSVKAVYRGVCCLLGVDSIVDAKNNTLDNENVIRQLEQELNKALNWDRLDLAYKKAALQCAYYALMMKDQDKYAEKYNQIVKDLK